MRSLRNLPGEHLPVEDPRTSGAGRLQAEGEFLPKAERPTLGDARGRRARVSLSLPHASRQVRLKVQLPLTARPVATQEPRQESLSLPRVTQRPKGTLQWEQRRPKLKRWMTLKMNILQNLPKKCLHCRALRCPRGPACGLRDKALHGAPAPRQRV